MKEELLNILGDLSYEDLQEALKAKKHTQIEKLKQRKAEILKKKREAITEYDKQLKEVDTELSELQGRKITRTKRRGAARASGELTEAILKCFESSSEPILTPADVLDMLPEQGYSGDIESIRVQMATYMGRLVKRGLLAKVKRGEFQLKTEK